jgi:hypothetical protein
MAYLYVGLSQFLNTSGKSRRAFACRKRTKAGGQHPDLIKEKSMSLATAHLHHKRDPHDIAGIKIPNSKFVREITELVRDTEFPLLFHHSTASTTGPLCRVRRLRALARKNDRHKTSVEINDVINEVLPMHNEGVGHVFET